MNSFRGGSPVERLDLIVEKRDALRLQERVAGDAQLAAEVKQVMLHVEQRAAQLLRQLLGKHQPEDRIELVHLAEGGDARVVLAHARAVAEACFAGIAGARGDLAEAMAHYFFLTSLSIMPSASLVVMRSPGRTAAALRRTLPDALYVML
jgi:hypothetical protein